jgi:Na+-transporting methylmalonyl-CoA/oxaloacetate decarboxylase gamma subunit
LFLLIYFLLFIGQVIYETSSPKGTKYTETIKKIRLYPTR